MRYVVILVKWGKLPEWSAKGPMTAKDRKFGFFCGGRLLISRVCSGECNYYIVSLWFHLSSDAAMTVI